MAPNDSQNDPLVNETVEVLAAASNGRWTPAVREETLGLLQSFAKLDQESKDRLLCEALSIVAQCVPPDAVTESTTGLVVGYVQSGKTMSYTTVAALARDNGYRMVIVITGTSVPLFGQSSGRLRRDLRLADRPDRKWQFFENPRPQGSDVRSIEDTLADWNDRSVPESEHQTVLITVMKNHSRLRDLIDILGSLDLSGVPVLVIDDEADQASLNTRVRQNDESTTYQRLLELRQRILHHTFLQYTATPQAPLLINIIDTLSPRFADVLTPGLAYTGGVEFFIAQPDLVSTIPPADVPSRNNALTEPPDSLLAALRVFFVGVADGTASGSRGNRSMLVHPSQSTGPHRQYLQWVTQAKDAWQQVLDGDPSDPDYDELIVDFRRAYDDLLRTAPDLLSFGAVIERLPRALRRTRVEEVNASRGRTPQVDWPSNYSYILVGGQAMDRGFTVEGLTVTYMPRPAGVGNADTIQQRARFFGYKREYLGLCRVYLESQVRDSFRSYIEHEEDVRNRLLQHRATGQPLTDWKRAFFLNSALRPTRANVLQLDYMQSSYSNEWYAPGAPHDSPEAFAANRAVVDAFVSGLEFEDDEGHPRRTAEQRHRAANGVPLRRVYEDLLTGLRTTWPSDSQGFTGLLLQVSASLEAYPETTCTIFQMSGGALRRRAVDDNGEIKNLFQGKNPLTGPVIYPGDREIRATNGLTVQIHRLGIDEIIKQPDGTSRRHELATDVPAIAVWVPAEMDKDWLVQRQGQ